MVLRRPSFAGEAMAHAITPGVVIGFVLTGLSVTSLLVGEVIAGVGAAAPTAWLSRRTILRGDAGLASIYLIPRPIGIPILSAAGSAVPLRSFLFVSILGIDDGSMLLVGKLATVTLVAFAFLLRPLIAGTCDPTFFEAHTHRPWVVEQGSMLLVLNLLAALKTLGTLMAVGLMILPATAARYWAGTITVQLGLGFAFALASCWAGLTLSYIFPKTPSGRAIVLVAGAIFALLAVFGPLGFCARLIYRPADAPRDAASSTPEERPQ